MRYQPSRRAALAAALAVQAFSPVAGLAWNNVGHETVARIAWDQLTPTARDNVKLLIRQHPALQHDLLRDMPADVGDQDMWAFVVSASWPDIVRDERNPWHAQYHHSAWHIINEPYVLPGTDTAVLHGATPGPTQWQRVTDPLDAVEALQKCEHDLRDPAVPGPEKACMLAWYLHVAGDIHQPLHANTLYSDRFPGGDRGGNSSLIRTPPLTTQPSLLTVDELPAAAGSEMLHAGLTTRPADLTVATVASPSTQPEVDRTMNLHAFWDGIFGRVNAPRVLDALQREITTEYPPAALRSATSDLDYASWAMESYRMAVRDVRRGGTLQTAAQNGQDRTTDALQVPPLPADYLARAQEDARLRMATAGYRIARVLNDVFAAEPQ